MKRFLSSLLSIVIVCSCFSCLAVTSASALDSRVESAVQWAINIANDNSHGYSQLSSRRWGNPDYDCSSLVITAFKNSGFNVGSATYTGNMRTQFEKAGFTWISKSQINLSNSSQLQRGDILLNEKKHVEIYIGNNQRVGAHTGYVDIYDTNYPGDNNGKEICIYNYTNSSNWDGVLRYNGVDTCNCSDSYAGNYTVTTNSSPLSMRSGHGTGYSVITSIPKGEQVYVSKSDGNWAHVKWNGYDGFCSMQYLTKNIPQEPINNNPKGSFDWIRSDNSGEIHLRGWAFDRDDVNAEILLHVYIDDKHYATIKADKSRPDVNEAYLGVGNNHGFEDVLIVNKSGNLNIKIFAINIGNGENVLITDGEKNISVTVDHNIPKIMKECTLDGHTYRLYACKTTWENAKSFCESKGGYLATITSAREQIAVHKLLSVYTPDSFYLGGNSTSGSWKWVTGEPFSYTAWATDQPDCSGNAEFYLGTYKHTTANDNLQFWNDFTNNYENITGFIFESGNLEENKFVPNDNPPTISYSAYIGDSWTQSINGEIIGTENKNRFKAIKVELKNCSGGIKYSAHFANTGWSDYVQDSEICGSTTNNLSSIEAIKMELYGDIANSYNVFYTAYVRDKGWFEWAKNGEIAGSTGGSLPITAIKVMLVPQVRYTSHIEGKGWTNVVKDKEISGTIGEALQLEALRIYLKDTSYGNIRYKTHLEYLGWGNLVYNGKESGTTSLALRAEALTVALDGKANELFDVMYKVHIQDKDWTNWLRNGDVAGTTGEALQIEAFKVMVVPKGYTGAESFKEYTSVNFTVTFDPMGGECDIKTKPISYCGFYGDLPTPQKTGYIFTGWYDSKDYNNLVTSSSTIETKSDVTLYARWIKSVFGDVDGNGEITIMDVTEIQRHIAQLITIPNDRIECADTDRDGEISIKDATKIQRFIAQLITEL